MKFLHWLRHALLSLQSPVPFKLIYNWWRAHFRELDTSSEDKELLPTCVHSCSLRANKIPGDPRINGRFVIWDHALELVEKTTAHLQNSKPPHGQPWCAGKMKSASAREWSAMYSWPKFISSPQPKDKFLVSHGDACIGFFFLQAQILSQDDCMENSPGQKSIYWHRSYSKSRKSNKTLRPS